MADVGKAIDAEGRTGAFLIRGLILAAAMAGAWMAPGWAAQSAPLSTLHAVHVLTKDEARGGLPVAFEATVTYYNPTDVDLFVQDGDEAIYVETERNRVLA